MIVSVHMYPHCSGCFLHIYNVYLVPLKTALPQPLCSPQDLPQWQLELAPCEAHLHLWSVQSQCFRM